MHITRNNPFWSEDNVMNMLLRYDNWNNATHTPLNLTYKVNVPYIGQPQKAYSDLEALMHVLSDTFGIEIRSTGPLGEYDIETKQGTFLTSEDWKFYDIIKKINNGSAYDTPKSEVKLAELGITKEQINSAFEGVKFASDVNIEKFSFMYEKIEAVKNSKSINQYQSTFKSFQEFEESLEVAKYTTSNLFELWARYADINIQPTNNISKIEIDVRLLRSKDDNSYFTVNSGPQYEYTEWDNGKTTSFKGVLSLIIWEPELSVMAISMNDFSADAFIELHHGIAHAFLDHPVDSLLFNGGRKDFKYSSWEDIVISSLTYNPFSLCMSVLGDVPCVKYPNSAKLVDASLKAAHKDYIEADDGEKVIYLEGKQVYPITPMPLDIKAMQYLYTPNCKNKEQEITYKFDDNGSKSIFGFKIPPQAIFTLWDCSKKSIIDASEVKGLVKLDLEPGAGHFNYIGEETFLIGYDAYIKTVHTGLNGGTVHTSTSGGHNIFLHGLNNQVYLEGSYNNIILANEESNLSIHNFFQHFTNSLYADNDIICEIIDLSNINEDHVLNFGNITIEFI